MTSPLAGTAVVLACMAAAFLGTLGLLLAARCQVHRLRAAIDALIAILEVQTLGPVDGAIFREIKRQHGRKG